MRTEVQTKLRDLIRVEYMRMRSLLNKNCTFEFNVCVCVCARPFVCVRLCVFWSKVEKWRPLCECHVGCCMKCLATPPPPHDCFCCTDTCQNTITILNYFMEYINDLHISVKTGTSVSRGKNDEYHCHNLKRLGPSQVLNIFPFWTTSNLCKATFTLFMLYLNVILSVISHCIVPFFTLFPPCWHELRCVIYLVILENNSLTQKLLSGCGIISSQLCTMFMSWYSKKK